MSNTLVAAAWTILAAIGSAEAGGGDEPQVAEIIIKAPVADVWKVLSTADGFKKLGVAQCEMDFRVGGLIRTHYSAKGTIGDEGTIENEILSYDPLRMVSIRVKKPPKGFPFSEQTWKGTWTVITLTDLGDGRTHFRIAGMGYPDTDEGKKMREFFKAGNSWSLEKLRSELEAGVSEPKGPAHAASTTAPISIERTIDLPRADVWKLYSTNEGWKTFFGVEAQIELEPGGKFEILFGKEAPEGQRGSEGCNVLSFVPGQMLSYTWNAPPSLPHARTKRTWVVVHFDEVSPARTRVRVDHLGFAEQAAANPGHEAEWAKARGYFQAAWPKVLDALESQEKK
jgi:uncharacterized protein YndB with AHSA1/START domain